MTVNSNWQSLPIAPRDTPFDFDDATARIQQWAAGDTRKYGSAFLWRGANLPANNKNSYRLPFGDISDGKLILVPHAIFTAAAILSGAHGGLEGVVSDEEKLQLKGVVTKIYEKFQEMWGDPRTKPPWLRGGNEVGQVTAAIAPTAPPAEWFKDPQLQGPTPLTITSDGQVFGHAFTWNQCHMGIGNACVVAPRTATDYAYFKTGSVVTADGQTIRVGKLTAGTGHADKRFGIQPAADHYDHTGSVKAVVDIGEDRWGGWVAGAMVPEATEEDAALLRRSPLSGDWRRVNGNLELVAALAVNSPGFPIVSLAASGEPDTMLSVGIVDQGVVDEVAERLNAVRRKEVKMRLSLLARTWNEGDHPRDPGGEDGGKFIEKGTVGIDEGVARKAAKAAKKAGGTTTTKAAPAKAAKPAQKATAPKLPSTRAVKPQGSEAAPDRAQATGVGGRKPIDFDQLFSVPGQEITADQKKEIASAYSGKFGDFKTEVNKVSWGDPTELVGTPYRRMPSISILGQVRDADGKVIGAFNRRLIRKPDGEVFSYHAMLKVNAAHQGQGFSKKFSKHVREWYKGQGVKKYTYTANSDVGGFAWARSGGADWEDRDSPLEWLNQVSEKLSPDNDYIEDDLEGIPPERMQEQIRLGRQMLERLRRTNFSLDSYPTPFEVSELGRWEGADPLKDWWIGKILMMGSDWRAVEHV